MRVLRDRSECGKFVNIYKLLDTLRCVDAKTPAIRDKSCDLISTHPFLCVHLWRIDVGLRSEIERM